jgi:hypothetical protein
MRKLLVTALGAGTITLVVAAGAHAAMMSFAYQLYINTEFSGATAPEGVPPWLTATFDDGGSAGSVDLTLQTVNLTDNEFLFEWLFNLDPSLDPTALLFSTPAKTGAFTDPTINLGVDSFKADGDGFFDIKIEFNNTDGAPTRFGVGDAIEYTITGIPTLTAHSFAFFSESGGGQGEYPTAAHVGGIGPDDADSGWVSVPEPATLAILAAGVLSVAPRRRR